MLDLAFMVPTPQSLRGGGTATAWRSKRSECRQVIYLRKWAGRGAHHQLHDRRPGVAALLRSLL